MVSNCCMPNLYNCSIRYAERHHFFENTTSNSQPFPQLPVILRGLNRLDSKNHIHVYLLLNIPDLRQQIPIVLLLIKIRTWLKYGRQHPMLTFYLLNWQTKYRWKGGFARNDTFGTDFHRDGFLYMGIYPLD